MNSCTSIDGVRQFYDEDPAIDVCSSDVDAQFINAIQACETFCSTLQTSCETNQADDALANTLVQTSTNLCSSIYCNCNDRCLSQYRVRYERCPQTCQFVNQVANVDDVPAEIETLCGTEAVPTFNRAIAAATCGSTGDGYNYIQQFYDCFTAGGTPGADGSLVNQVNCMWAYFHSLRECVDHFFEKCCQLRDWWKQIAHTQIEDCLDLVRDSICECEQGNALPIDTCTPFFNTTDQPWCEAEGDPVDDLDTC